MSKNIIKRLKPMDGTFADQNRSVKRLEYCSREWGIEATNCHQLGNLANSIHTDKMGKAA